MKISRAAEYAVRCVFFLSTRERGAILTRNQISQNMEIPKPFLVKITQQLARAGIIEILQGSKGGVRLLKNSEKITLLEVVEAIIGKIFLNECVQYKDRKRECCRRKSKCSVHRVWCTAQEQLRETLRKGTFQKLIKEGFCFKGMLKQKG